MALARLPASAGSALTAVEEDVGVSEAHSAGTSPLWSGCRSWRSRPLVVEFFCYLGQPAAASFGLRFPVFP